MTTTVRFTEVTLISSKKSKGESTYVAKRADGTEVTKKYKIERREPTRREFQKTNRYVYEVYENGVLFATEYTNKDAIKAINNQLLEPNINQ